MTKKTNDGKRGGNLVGKPHNDKNGNPVGGIKAVVTDAGGKPVELEGGEVIINKEASKKHWRELSRINQSAGNGVPIHEPVDPHDYDPDDSYKDGGKIEFNANELPNRWILSYAEKIRTKHPEIWNLGGNIFGNEAYKNLKRVAERGYWLDSEEWMYKKWRSFVARHKQDFRIAGVIAMLKWVDKVDRGWAYMKDLIEAEIQKREGKKKKGWKTDKSKRMSEGGGVKAETNYINIDTLIRNKLNYEIVTNFATLKMLAKADFIELHQLTGEKYKNYNDKTKSQVIGKVTNVRHDYIKSAKEPLFNFKGREFAIGYQKGLNFFRLYVLEYDPTLNRSKDGDGRVKMAYGGSVDFENELFDELAEHDAPSFGDGGNVTTYKHKFNKKYGFSKNESHSLSEIADITNIKLSALQDIYDKGIGAYKTNPQSVRPNVKSKEQWAMARVYSAVMGGKAARVDANELERGRYADGGNMPPAIEEQKPSLGKRAKDLFRAAITPNPVRKLEYLKNNPDVVMAAVTRNPTHLMENGGEVYYTRTYHDGRVEKYSQEYYENNILPFLPIQELERGRKYHLGGDMTKHLAPNGKPSNLTHEQWHLVRTPEFKTWFGDWEKLAMAKLKDAAMDEVTLANLSKDISKAIDENGEPLVVYHGTYVENPFYVFDFNKADIGFHFGTYEQAKNRSETKLFFKGRKSIVNSFFLNIKTIFEATDIGEWEYPQRYIDMFVSDGLISESDAKNNGFYRLVQKEENKQIREYLLNKYGKFVGLVYNNKYEGKGKSFIVLNPSQIKLANGTNTTFDGSNPDIRYEDGGVIYSAKQKVLSGEINSDDAAILIYDSGLEVTDELYDELREAENNYKNKGKGLQVGDLVIVKGKYGNEDFEANYRGVMPDGKLLVWTKSGSQIAISKDEIINSVSDKYATGGNVFDKYLKSGSILDDEAILSKYGLKRFTLQNKYNIAHLDTIISNEKNSGAGTRAMNDLIEWADSNGITMALTPSTSYGATSVSRLKDFYKRFGFVDNKGANKVWNTTASMIRKPQISKYATGSELAKGIKTEMEHSETINKFKRSNVSTEQVATAIAKDHLEENKKYYSRLSDVERKMKQGGNTFVARMDTPDGEQTRLTYFQQTIVRTKAFKDFFGDWETAAKNFIADGYRNFDIHYANVSKVINLQTLEPIVLFHGTNTDKEFYDFDVATEKEMGRPYAYFSYEEKYAENFMQFSQRNQTGVPLKYKAFINLRRPLYAVGDKFELKRENEDYWFKVITDRMIFDMLGSNPDEQKVQDLKNVFSTQIYSYLVGVFNANKLPFWTAMARDTRSVFKRFLMTYKYDGIIYHEEISTIFDESDPSQYTKAVTVFNANDIKLADGRNLTFDPMKSDVRYADGGNIDTTSVEVKPVSKIDELGKQLFGNQYVEKIGMFDGEIVEISEPAKQNHNNLFVQNLINKLKK